MKNQQKKQKKQGYKASLTKLNPTDKLDLTQKKDFILIEKLDLQRLHAGMRNIVELAYFKSADTRNFPEGKVIKPYKSAKKISKTVLKTIKRQIGMYGGPGALLNKFMYETIVGGIFEYHPSIQDWEVKQVMNYLQRLKNAQSDDRKRRERKTIFPL